LDPWLLIRFLFLVIRGLGEVYLYDPFNYTLPTVMAAGSEATLTSAVQRAARQAQNYLPSPYFLALAAFPSTV